MNFEEKIEEQKYAKKKEDLKIDGLFYAIGHKPNSDIFLPWVDVDDHGYIKVTDFVKTKTPGVFAAGDIADPTFKQAITAAGMGCQAAITAARYLETLHQRFFVSLDCNHNGQRCLKI